MRSVLARNPLVSFFLLAFLLSWIAVLPLLLSPGLPVEPFQALGAFAGPTLAAVIVLAASEGRASLRPFFARYVQWRAGIIWWLIVLFGVLVALTLVATLVVGAQVLSAFFANIGPVLVTYLITLIVGVILGPLWEEPGWRGFALPRLQERHGPLFGTLILGVLWAFWHAPGYWGGWLTASPLSLLVGTIAFSIVMTWVYNNTGGSILLMILFHSSSNAALAVGGRVLPANLPEPLSSFVGNGWIPALTYTIAALLIVLATRGRLSYKKNET